MLKFISAAEDFNGYYTSTKVLVKRRSFEGVKKRKELKMVTYFPLMMNFHIFHSP